MQKVSKDYGQSLLQKNPSREALLEKMRDKLARNLPVAQVREIQKKEVRIRTTAAWSIRIILGLMLIGVNFLIFGQKENIIAHIGYQAVPSLPKPAPSLTADEKALYWTYALYDFQKFRTHFNIQGYYAVDQKGAKKSLNDLLPLVTNATLGKISAYSPVAFREVKYGGSEQ